MIINKQTNNIFNNSIIKQLKDIVGSKNLITDTEGVYAYSFDCAHVSIPNKIERIVVFPENTLQVSEILKIANKYKIPVIPKGAGSNHAGGCAPLKGGIILHFSRMNKILDINTQNMNCKVQPGVVVGDLQTLVEKKGLFFPPDPSNLAISTIGGGIALSSGGPRAFKYGTFKDYVLDLEIVLSNGTIMHTGAQTAKNVTGYNLTQLIVGSEGTLGIVTEATLKLIPKPEYTNVMLVYFDSIKSAVDTVSEIINKQLSPSVIDLLDDKTIQTIESFLPTGLKTDEKAVLLIECDGDKNSVYHQQNQIIDICKKQKCSYIDCAKSEEHRKQIWTARRSAFGACAKLAPNVITEDVVVPRENIAKLAEGISKLSEKYDITTLIMGHVADGNIHPNFALDLRNPTQKENFEKLKTELFKLSINLGGTLSGEHGIGCQKSKYMPIAIDKVSLEIMKQIKQIFDENNILNPNKIF